jgi:O-antigen ligase/tetratricopeptide (TPR) repeat protein
VNSNTSSKTDGWGLGHRQVKSGRPAADILLRVVDAGLCGVIFVAPYFFGGRHDMGRLLLVSIIAVTATAWFVRQAMMPAARWPRTIAYVLLVLVAALVAIQIVPLPQEWIVRLSPRTSQLLPLWSGTDDGAAHFGSWQTLSLMPHETTKSLAMVLSYALLFVVVIGRIEEKTDAERLLQCVAASAVVMALFGLVHYATTDGRFFWFYWYPHRLATQNISGPFINRNHFADFLVLGVGPLLAWLIQTLMRFQSAGSPRKAASNPKDILIFWVLGATAVLVIATILLTRSHGGALAMLVAGGVLVTAYLACGLADRRFIYGLVGLAVVVVGFLSIHGYDQVAQRLDDFTEGSLDDLDHGGIRRTVWAANIAAFEAGWLTGAGAGSHREMCPVYLPQRFTKEYTHAENGYLQIASENGIGGIVLLAGGIVLCGTWCIGGLRRATDPDVIRLLGASAAGLAASAVHSLVDFVWYIPSCMTITIILAGCALRLSQLARCTEEQTICCRTLKRGRWIERAAAAMLVGAWTVHTFVGPGMAAIFWESYRQTAVSNSELSRRQLDALVDSKPSLFTAEQERLNDLMVGDLQQVVRWDPHFARAHLCLAAKYIAQFDLRQQEAENAMSFGDICDSLASASFHSPREQQAWLERAFGPNLDWLRRAAVEARIAATLCPLQGKAYAYLAQLSILDAAKAAATKPFVEQALRVRPNDAEVLFEVGRQNYIVGDITSAVERWKECFDDSGPHQIKIVYLLSGRLTASEFLKNFQPDWRTLRGVWNRYHESGKQEDIDAILSYSANCSAHETEDDYGIPPAYVWYWQAKFYADAGRADDALKCLQRAYTCGGRHYFIRQALAQGLYAAGRFAEAEPHYRWCMARHPDDSSLSNALVDISKQRLSQRMQMIEAAQLDRSAAAAAQLPTQACTVVQPQVTTPIQPPPSTPGQPQAVVPAQFQIAAPAQPQATAPVNAPVAVPR